MAPTVINIQGRATISTVAERAALVVEVSDSGYDKDQVSKNVINTITTLQGELDQLCPRLDNNDGQGDGEGEGEGESVPDAPVSFYTISSLSTSSRDEGDDNNTHTDTQPARTGKEIFTAQTELDIRFRDFAKLGAMVVTLSSTPFVDLRGITWKLTKAKQATLDEQVRMDALRQAIQRARRYAEIIGRSETVVPVRIRDDQEFWPTGLLKQTAPMAAAGAVFSIGSGIDFEPQLIEVNATVEVEFHAE